MIDFRTPQQRLCSRENAERLATRMFEQFGQRAMVLRTSDPDRPYIATQRPCGTEGVVDIVVTA